MIRCGGRVVECGGLLNRCTGKTVPGVRIPPAPFIDNHKLHI